MENASGIGPSPTREAAGDPSSPRSGRDPWLWSLIAVILALKALHLAVAIWVTGPPFDTELFATTHPLVAWDGKHFLGIAERGYPPLQDGKIPYAVAFFPVLPILANLLSPVLDLPTGLVVAANLCSLGGFILLYLWARRVVGPSLAFWSGVLLAAYPPSFFFSAAYSEGPLMLATAAALLLSARRQYLWAALVAGVASAARPTGVIVSLFVFFDAALYLRRESLKDLLPRLATIGVLSVSGLVAFCAMQQVRYGDPLAFVNAQNQYGAKADPAPAAPGEPAVVEAPPAPAPVVAPSQPPAPPARSPLIAPFFRNWNTPLAYAIFGLSVVALIRPEPIRRLDLLFPIANFLLAYIPGRGVRLNSIARCEACALPFFVLAAYWLSRRFHPWVLVVVSLLGLVVQLIYVWKFQQGIWAG